MPDRYREYLTRFQALSPILKAYSPYWQIIPFDYLELPWQHKNPELHAFLNRLDRENILDIERLDGTLSSTVQPFLPESRLLNNLTDLPVKTPQNNQYDPRLHRYVAGRKWEQVKAFADAIHSVGDPVLEWCSGKGHLGRLLAYTSKTSVDSLEQNKTLCEQGRELARKAGVSMRFHPVDVMSPVVTEHMRPEQHAVALHACGDLHLTLISLGVEQGVKKVSLSPCCYHKITDDFYQPLSEAGLQHDLRLRRFDLKLPVQEEVTAPLRIRRLRETQLQWRLAFDLYYRDVTGATTYQPVPTVKESLLKTDLKTFFKWAAGRCGIRYTNSIDFADYARRARARRVIISRIEMVRHVFRRSLEIWLVLDRALYLIEHGYDVEVSTFCKKSITPRNILIHAEKQ